jgi:hypothetical protein
MRSFSTYCVSHPALTLLCTAALTACGGGGTSGELITALTTSEKAATAYSANAAVVASDASTAVDTSVQTAQAVVATQPPSVASVPVTCPGGGTALLTVTGGTPASVLNGQLETGEVYQLVFSACRGAAGAAAVNGTLAMTVQTASATDLAMALNTTDLAVALPRGTVKLTGSVNRQLTSTTTGSTTQLTSQLSTPSLTVATQFNARSSAFTLSAVNITRQITLQGGVVQSTSYSGTHSLAATLPNGAFSYSVSTQGNVLYSATGVPTSGTWSLALPNTLITTSVGNAQATITIDEAKDGTVDKTFVLPVTTMLDDAG